MDFSNLDFKAIDTEVLTDKAKEQEETTAVAATRGEDAADAGGADLGQGGYYSFCLAKFKFFFFKLFFNNGCLLFLRLLFFCLRTLVAFLF